MHNNRPKIFFATLRTTNTLLWRCADERLRSSASNRRARFCGLDVANSSSERGGDALVFLQDAEAAAVLFALDFIRETIRACQPFARRECASRARFVRWCRSGRCWFRRGWMRPKAFALVHLRKRQGRQEAVKLSKHLLVPRRFCGFLVVQLVVVFCQVEQVV